MRDRCCLLIFNVGSLAVRAISWDLYRRWCQGYITMCIFGPAGSIYSKIQYYPQLTACLLARNPTLRDSGPESFIPNL